MASQHQKYERFVALHKRDKAIVMPNPWNAGSAVILETLGFEALATTSAGYAFDTGQRDAQAGLNRDEILENAAQIVAATDLPVSCDLEDGFGPDPKICAETIALACDVGLVGGSIEDATGDPDAPLYSFDAAVDRVRAAAEVARDRPFLLTARAEGFSYGTTDLEDIIARLQAFSEAGADVLYAPELPSLDAITTVCAEVDKPLNVVMGLSGPTWSVADLSRAGVRRISVGGSFARAAYGALIRAASEVHEHGTFGYAADAIPDPALRAMMPAGKSDTRT